VSVSVSVSVTVTGGVYVLLLGGDSSSVADGLHAVLSRRGGWQSATAGELEANGYHHP
jgi:hypothetical protein